MAVPARPAAAGLHDHRLRRLGPHLGGDACSARVNVPRGIVRSVWCRSSSAGSCSAPFVLAMPDLDDGARQGAQRLHWLIGSSALPDGAGGRCSASASCSPNYLCGLAARDLDLAHDLRLRPRRRPARSRSAAPRQPDATARPSTRSGHRRCSPSLSTLYTPAFSTLAAGCAVFLYISYAMPVAAGLLAEGRTWTRDRALHARRPGRSRSPSIASSACARPPDRHRHPAAERQADHLRGSACWSLLLVAGSAWSAGASRARRSAT